MGHGISIRFAMYGFRVFLYGRSTDSLQNARLQINKTLELLNDLGVVTYNQNIAILNNIKLTTNLKECVSVSDLIIESIKEDIEEKQILFNEIYNLSKPTSILTSNTSSLMPKLLFAKIPNKKNVAVTHYINPAVLVPLVEIVKHEETTEDTISRLTDILKGTGSQPIIIEKETPGFVTSRLQSALLREALWLVENEIASASDVDKAISHGLGRRWASAGIFEILELAGWDLLSIIATNIFPELSKSDTPKLLNEKVNANEIGIKTKKGFYEWTDDSIHELRHKIAKGLVEIQNWDRQKSP
jgi:3-hydroxybutyryl-CoA dehydrogenase